jgi:chloramphenicol-sensitive protein RarD
MSSPPTSDTAQPDTSVASARAAARGVFALLGAFVTWGLMVLYLRQLAHVPPLQIIMYRAIFCCVFVFGFLRVRGDLSEVWAALLDPGVRKRLIASALCISINWLTFTWAVTNSHVVESSLGYYINPLVNVLLGVVVLGERLRRIQWLSIALAAAGVVYLAWLAQAPPFIALVVAFSFGVYGLIRKTVAVGALAGLAAETLLVLPLGVLYLVGCEWSGTGVIARGDGLSLGLLIASGVITAVPLALFSYGARLVPYSTVGLLQYISPTIQLLFGVYLYGEAFDASRALGFACIWAALALYAAEGLSRRRAV